MLHLLDQACGFRPPQEAFHIPQSCAEAYSTDSNSTAKTLWALCEFIGILRSLPVQCSPFPGASTHVTRSSSAAKALQTFILLTACNPGTFQSHLQNK
jgi:hypothetical protein